MMKPEGPRTLHQHTKRPSTAVQPYFSAHSLLQVVLNVAVLVLTSHWIRYGSKVWKAQRRTGPSCQTWVIIRFSNILRFSNFLTIYYYCLYWVIIIILILTRQLIPVHAGKLAFEQGWFSLIALRGPRPVCVTGKYSWTSFRQGPSGALIALKGRRPTGFAICAVYINAPRFI